jgi:hypothetical protein
VVVATGDEEAAPPPSFDAAGALAALVEAVGVQSVPWDRAAGRPVETGLSRLGRLTTATPAARRPSAMLGRNACSFAPLNTGGTAARDACAALRR